MRARACFALGTALAISLFTALAAAEEPPVSPPAGAASATEPGEGRSRSHLVLSAIVAATFLVFGAVAGRRKGGGPMSRRSLRPSSRRPL